MYKPTIPTLRVYSIDVSASRLANNPKIALRIQELRDAAVTPLIADIIARKVHATSVMRDPNVHTRDQLAANRLIGQYEGDFVKKVQVEGNISVEQKALVVQLEAKSIEELRELLEMIEGEQRALGEGNA